MMTDAPPWPGAEDPHAASSQKPALLLLAAVTCLAFFTSHATLSVDPPTRYLEAKALVNRGSFEIHPPADRPLDPGIFPGKDGKLYSYFGKGQSLIFAAPYFVCSRLLGIESDKLIRSVISLTVFPFTLGLTALVFFLLLREFGFSARACYLGALLLVLATGLWQLSKEGQEGNHLAFYYTLCAFGLKRYQNTAALRPLALSALAIAAAFLTRTDTAPMVLCYLLFATYLIYQKSRPAGAKCGSDLDLGRFVAGTLLVIALTLPALFIQAAINLKLFGHPLSGYDRQFDLFSLSRLPIGLKGLLFSPGRGLFLYNPIMILAVAGFIALWRRHREWGLFILAGFAGCFLRHAAYPVFHGNCCWGPRYLIRHSPLLFIPVAFFAFGPTALPKLRRALVILVVAVSIFVQVAAVSLHHNRELSAFAQTHPDAWHWTMYEPDANFLTLRLANLSGSIDEMIHDQIATWPTQPDHLLTPQQKAQAPTLRYLAFWPFHLTYYLPALNPSLALPLWTSALVLTTGLLAAGLLMAWGWKSCPLSTP